MRKRFRKGKNENIQKRKTPFVSVSLLFSALVVQAGLSSIRSGGLAGLLGFPFRLTAVAPRDISEKVTPSGVEKMHRLLLLFTVLFVFLLLASDSPKVYDDAVTLDGLEGRWRLVAHDFNGVREVAEIQVVISFHCGTFESSEGNAYEYECYKIDSTRKPPHLDWMPSRPIYEMIKTHAAIYEINGDTLKIAFMAGVFDLQRPKGFNDKGVITYIYKRVK